jgi:hypothetical protein
VNFASFFSIFFIHFPPFSHCDRLIELGETQSIFPLPMKLPLLVLASCITWGAATPVWEGEGNVLEGRFLTCSAFSLRDVLFLSQEPTNAISSDSSPSLQLIPAMGMRHCLSTKMELRSNLQWQPELQRTLRQGFEGLLYLLREVTMQALLNSPFVSRTPGQGPSCCHG